MSRERIGRQQGAGGARRASWAFLALAALAGCGPPGRTVPETIDAFLEAVQAQELDALYCLMAGAAQAEELGVDEAERHVGFESWVMAQFDEYLQGREEGQVELDPQGLVLVKLFALGRGTYYAHTGSRSAGSDVRVVRTEVRFGYANIDLSGFSPGTTFYVCGAPVGRVHPIRVPEGSREVTVELLTEVELEWTLIRTPEARGCAAGWAVASVAPVEGSAASAEVTWVF